MPPRLTRSQTARSHLPNPPSLTTLEEDLWNLAIEDGETKPRSPVQPPSPDHNPAEERREGVEICITPRSRKIQPTDRSVQRNGACNSDPNEGRCLITNRPTAVQLCHLIARATDDEMLTKLEYVWKIGHRQLHLDTRRNMMYLRSDWHFLFDQQEWVLVPEYGVLQELSKIYVEDKCVTSDITKLFVDPTYQYYVLPAPTLQEPICRFPNTSNHDHETHFPPFPNLGSLRSHIHPHFVIFNTGRKLASLVSHVPEMIFSLSQIVTPSLNAISMVVTIQRLYATWTGVQVPDHYYNLIGTSNRFSPPSEEGRDDRSQGGPPPRHQSLRSVTRSRGRGSQASAGKYAGGQQRAVLPFPTPENDSSSSVTGDTVVEDDTDWIEYIHNWQKQGDGAMERWESDVLNGSCDEQLAAYTDEHARTPPSPGTWDSWKSALDDSTSRYPTRSDRSRFSSNDWAVFKSNVYLTRPEHPPVIL